MPSLARSANLVNSIAYIETLQFCCYAGFVNPIDTSRKTCYTIDMTPITEKQIQKYKSMEAELREFYRLRNEEIVRLYGDGNNGWTYKGLADKFGLKRQRVARIVMSGKEGRK